MWSNLLTLEGRKIEDRRTNRRTNVEQSLYPVSQEDREQGN